MTATEIADKLNAKRSGDGWIAKCPAHDDRNASLSIGEGTAGLLLHCHAGCEYLDILAAIGVEPEKRAQSAPRVQRAPTLRADLWWQATRRVTAPAALVAWADRLSMPVESIDHLGAAVHGDTLCFPMHDGEGRVCGIRTRYQDHSKAAITGSRAGLFLPTLHTDADPVVCEGPTDSAAALALGYEPIGMPSCTGHAHVAETCQRFKYEKITICADADGPGMAGAEKLAERLRAARVMVRIVAAGRFNDLREWLANGATRSLVDMVWRQRQFT